MVIERNTQVITIKGTRDGLTFFLDDSCTFEEITRELSEKVAIAKPKEGDPLVPVVVKLGNRYLLKEQVKIIKDIIESGNGFSIEMFDSDVIHRNEALKWIENNEVKVFNRIVRSGQVLKVTGDLLLIGDVNPGGRVISTGNIYIMGSLYGIAHAGSEGNENAIIVASYMKPIQLKIADYISRSPDYESDGVFMECGFIDQEKDKIIVDRLQVLTRKRRNISEIERRMLNG